MDDNTMYVRIWTMVIILLIVITTCIAAYNIVDRIGPLRPIVTNTTQFQAK